MKVRIGTIVVIAAMTLGLVACGSTATDMDNTTTTATTSYPAKS